MRPILRNTGPKHENTLRVLTYNVLAQSLIRDQYPTNGDATTWSERFPALREELIAYKPDILFLQEVDDVKLLDWKLLLESTALDMDFVFGSAPKKSHGIIVAINRANLRLVHRREMHYDLMDGPPQQIDTRCFGVAAPVEIRNSGVRLLIGTTHLYWHPDASYEKLRQVLLFLDRVVRLQKEYGATGLVLGGDFNSTPDSPAYQFLKTGKIHPEEERELMFSARATRFGPLNGRRGYGFPSLIRNATVAVRELKKYANQLQAPHLTSCYDALTGEPAFTNWTDTFRETIDYIFVSDEMAPKSVVPLPVARDLGPEPSSLPRRFDRGQGYPSDHLVLIADIELKPSANNGSTVASETDLAHMLENTRLTS